MANTVDIFLGAVGNGQTRSAAPAAGELWLALNSRQWASDIVARGIGDLPRGMGDVRRVVLLTSGTPTLDEMLAASFAAWILEDGALPPGAEALARYAALARAGYNPSKVPVEYSIAGIYQAITWSFGTHLTEDAAAKLVAEWQRVAAVLRQAMRDGGDPFTEQLFSESGGFAREIISLRSDRQVYGQDVKAGMRFRIQLAGSAATNSALILRQPKSLLFKEWARSDAQSPTGDGYLLLGVEWDAGDWVLSTDPVQRISLKPLAEALDGRERAKGSRARWFDGAPFAHSLIAAPKAEDGGGGEGGGTQLTPKEVLAVFVQWAHARPAEAHARNSTWKWPAVAACALMLAGVCVWGMTHRQPGLTNDPSVAATELDELHVRTLASRGEATSANLGMFVGINEFRNNAFPQLTFAVDDAVAQAHLFALELALIEPRNLVLAIQGSPGTRRGMQQLKELQAKGVTVTTAFRSDILGGLMKLNSISQQEGGGGGLLVVSMSTHGMELPGGAYVIPHDGLRGSADQDIAVDAIDHLMSQSKAGKHLLIVDACRETPRSDSRDVAAGMNADFLAALAAAKGQKVMASCSAGQLSYEVPAKGHGIFTYWMLLGLKGGAAADGRGLITVGTMEQYLKKQVADYSAHHAPGVQTPWFSADDGSQDIPLAVPE